MIKVDHIRIASRNALESARALAEVLGVAEPRVAGKDGEMSCLDLEQQPSLLLEPSETVGLEHIAFRVDQRRFTEVVSRLREDGIEFGNHPDNPHNGRTDDPLGVATGRVFFLNTDGHLFEVIC